MYACDKYMHYQKYAVVEIAVGYVFTLPFKPVVKIGFLSKDYKKSFSSFRRVKIYPKKNIIYYNLRWTHCKGGSLQHFKTPM